MNSDSDGAFVTVVDPSEEDVEEKEEEEGMVVVAVVVLLWERIPCCFTSAAILFELASASLAALRAASTLYTKSGRKKPMGSTNDHQYVGTVRAGTEKFQQNQIFDNSTVLLTWYALLLILS